MAIQNMMTIKDIITSVESFTSVNSAALHYGKYVIIDRRQLLDPFSSTSQNSTWHESQILIAVNNASGAKSVAGREIRKTQFSVQDESNKAPSDYLKSFKDRADSKMAQDRGAGRMKKPPKRIEKYPPAADSHV